MVHDRNEKSIPRSYARPGVPCAGTIGSHLSNAPPRNASDDSERTSRGRRVNHAGAAVKCAEPYCDERPQVDAGPVRDPA